VQNAVSLTEALPYSVEYKGKKYKLTPAFDNVLKACEIADGDFTEGEKIDLCLHFLLKGRHPKEGGLLEAVFDILLPRGKREEGGEKALDFWADAPRIYAAFLQAYGIDLLKERGKLHWFSFLALLNNLPGDTKLVEIIGIRTRPMPKPTKHNSEERMRLLKLKAFFRLETTEAERQRNLQAGFKKMAMCLLNMAEGKNGKG